MGRWKGPQPYTRGRAISRGGFCAAYSPLRSYTQLGWVKAQTPQSIEAKRGLIPLAYRWAPFDQRQGTHSLLSLRARPIPYVCLGVIPRCVYRLMEV